MIDVATRSILAAVLRPVATKSMDLMVVLACQTGRPHVARIRKLDGWGGRFITSVGTPSYARLKEV